MVGGGGYIIMEGTSHSARVLTHEPDAKRYPDKSNAPHWSQFRTRELRRFERGPRWQGGKRNTEPAGPVIITVHHSFRFSILVCLQEHERIYVRWVKARSLSRDGISSHGLFVAGTAR
ncbi:hypothetical protein D9C73_019300 [Collichthys lucidus]|uniref:Uncharacterized protein n=1 Tax=Collichthys lucidus TaxID=240159 RepID=A0A4V6ARX0_COLLU|nr:hypothetical protein D9C73_019300 [Collichthys lucidus]